MTTSTLRSSNPRLRAQLFGATIAFVVSIGAFELFRRAAWPGPHVAQWTAFCAIAWLTNIRGVPRAKWPALGLIWAADAALMIWLTTVAAHA